MEQDFKGSCNGKLNPEFKSLAMVRNKEECEERQDELENVVKCCEKWHESYLYITGRKQIKRWKCTVRRRGEQGKEVIRASRALGYRKQKAGFKISGGNI